MCASPFLAVRWSTTKRSSDHYMDEIDGDDECETRCLNDWMPGCSESIVIINTHIKYISFFFLLIGISQNLNLGRCVWIVGSRPGTLVTGQRERS
jgi:hypothetical protein